MDSHRSTRCIYTYRPELLPQESSALRSAKKCSDVLPRVPLFDLYVKSFHTSLVRLTVKSSTTATIESQSTRCTICQRYIVEMANLG